MEKNDIKTYLEELNIEDIIIEDIISKIDNKKEIAFTTDQMKELQEMNLKIKIKKEKDWRKKSSLAAKIISLNLD